MLQATEDGRREAFGGDGGPAGVVGVDCDGYFIVGGEHVVGFVVDVAAGGEEGGRDDGGDGIAFGGRGGQGEDSCWG